MTVLNLKTIQAQTEINLDLYRTVVYMRTIVLNGNSYKIGSLIGAGLSGRIFEAYDIKNKKIVAIKFSPIQSNLFLSYQYESLTNIEAQSEETFNLVKERLVSVSKAAETARKKQGGLLYVPTHIEIVQLSSAFYDLGRQSETQLSFGVSIMDFASDNLESICKEIPKPKTRQRMNDRIELAAQVFENIQADIEAMAEHGLGHFDINPSNIGHDENTKRYSLLDWGSIRSFGKSKDTSVGEKVQYSPYFGAPETLTDGQFSISADLYSLAHVLYSILNPNYAEDYLEPLADFNDIKFLDLQKFEGRIASIRKVLIDGSVFPINPHFERLVEFIQSASIPHLPERRMRLLETSISQGLKKMIGPTPLRKSDRPTAPSQSPDLRKSPILSPPDGSKRSQSPTCEALFRT